MKYFYSIICLMSLCLISHADTPADLIKKAQLLFEDDFNRSETDDSKEELGKGWKTNSAKRAQGVKQADLKDGALYIKMAKVADHGVSILRTAPFDDGIVKVRFKMLDSKGIKFNFNDPKARKIAWAGHVCSIAFNEKIIIATDQITGIFRLDIHNKKKAGASKAEIKELTKGKSKAKKTSLKLQQWYELALVIRGATLEVYLDGTKMIEFASEGFDHRVKDNLAFAVNGEAVVDDLKIWSLD